MKSEKKKLDRILGKDYSRTRLKKTQAWYMSTFNGSGYGEFLTLEETKRHLLEKAQLMKEAVQQLKFMVLSIEETLEELEITGNLFEDTLNVEYCLGQVDLMAEMYREAFRKFDEHEFRASKRYYSGCSLFKDEEAIDDWHIEESSEEKSDRPIENIESPDPFRFEDPWNPITHKEEN